MKRKYKLRAISESFIVPQPGRVVTRTRYYPTEFEKVILGRVGSELSHLEGWALRKRCQMGSDFTKVKRAELKRELTAKGLTSRQAGSITGRVMGMWRAQRQAQARELRSLSQRISTIESKLKKRAGSKGAYYSPSVCFQKSQKLKILNNVSKLYVRITGQGRLLLFEVLKCSLRIVITW